MVPAHLASLLEPGKHCCERNVVHCCSCSSVGTPLVWSAHRISLRQHGGGSGIVSKVSQPPNPVSFAQVPVFWEARHNFEHSADHLAGKSNTAADTLSRNNLKSFRSLTSQAKAVPTVVPAQVLSLLMDPNLHWTVQKFFEQDLAAAISRTYASAKNRYLSFCQQANILPYSITQPTLPLRSLPCSTGSSTPVCLLLPFSCETLKVHSCTTATSRSSWPYLHYILMGKKRSARGSNAAWSRLPISPDILCQLRSVWVPDNFSKLLPWITACLAFFGFMLMGEVTSMPGTPPTITVVTLLHPLSG